ncbi:MAG: hypothetical protein A2W35_06645 [Chloroflexi bacterium RBG_16_57_11]|nr:MAG: hypothetical protein A2W35_06645 [Chloroflexi bacterium RBG_16_57_11]
MQSDIKKITIYRPFANGSQFADWTGKNCGNCKKSTQGTFAHWICDVEKEIWKTYYGTGKMSEEIARRMNYLRDDGSNAGLEYGWPCAEIEPTSEWIEHAVQYWRELHAK